ncbi:MAG: glutaredoxin 3 [Woeseiaceae bacterium]|jgi:glutaredoxin 3
MKPVTMYGNAMCPYCGAARMLLTKKGIKFTDIDVAASPEQFAEMQERSGARTVPQIFIGDTSIGGFDDLYALDKNGELDKILAA